MEVSPTNSGACCRFGTFEQSDRRPVNEQLTNPTSFLVVSRDEKNGPEQKNCHIFHALVVGE